MNETEQKLLERAIMAETQAKFLLEALKKIEDRASLGGSYSIAHIAESAINGYEKSKE